LYRAIMRGFDKQLVAISTTTGAFLDGARQHQLLTKRQITGLAVDAQQQVFYGVDNATGELVRIDPATGGAESIGQTGIMTVRDVAFDPGRRLLYAIAGDALSEEAYLLRLDPWQALATRVGAIGVSCSGLAFDADRDILYCSDRELVRLDLDTGRGRRIGPWVSPRSMAWPSRSKQEPYTARMRCKRRSLPLTPTLAKGRRLAPYGHRAISPRRSSLRHIYVISSPASVRSQCHSALSRFGVLRESRR
jgi:hypothetical protein